ncbi:MAG: ABC transporter ATP-binding protein [Acidobacteria bacterium]|nr:ABC transporter ATP-binding protein [Acidobacteriota bacterium]
MSTATLKAKKLVTPSGDIAVNGVGAAAATVIQLEGVSVSFYIPREKVSSLKEHAIRFLKGKTQEDEFQALKKVSVEIKQGEILGVVGKNGAGKSTLMRVMARVLKPSEGRVKTTGMVSPLLELGAGFHPDLTGRENVFLNGTLLGRSQAEMAERFDAIVDFAELWEFIDAPLRTYSSGMMARLGFATATAFQPEILLLDELLSVGDEKFHQKCFRRIEEFKASGTTFIIVSHSSHFIRSACDRVLWLDRGKIRLLGEAEQVIEKYQAFLNS